MAGTLLLNYAGPSPVGRRSFLGRCWRAISFAITLVLLIAFVAVRAVILLAGFTCVLLGTLLLVLGGKRDAAIRLRAWRERWVDLVHLWASDLARPMRRWRATRALPAAPVVEAPETAP